MKTAREVIAQAVDATFMQRGFNADRHAEAVLTALSAAGWRVVPEKASFEMMKEGAGVIAAAMQAETETPIETLLLSTGVAYAAMLAASPKD